MDRNLRITVMLLIILITVIDYFVPVGYNVWLLYLIPVMLAFSIKRKGAAYIVAAVEALFLILGRLFHFVKSIRKPKSTTNVKTGHFYFAKN